ncbi:MAG: malate dehydrogenase [Campylobacterota bacterium]|nr:malate dehydrogenase [Campylobacterota bacterium]
MKNRKVGIIGAGAVGATAAYSLTMMAICKEIVLYDINTDIAIGKAIDISQSTTYSTNSTIVTGAKEASELTDCDIIVITAGLPRKDGMTREDLLMINAKIMKDVLENVKKYSPDAIIVCVSNPLDVMTYVAHKITGWSRDRIIGMAGALDNSRMAYQIKETTKFGGSDIKAMVIGDHGENMIPCTELSTVGGIPLSKLVSKQDMENIIDRTKNGGATIVKHLGTSAYYAPGRAVAVMVDAILNDTKIIMPSSVILDGEYGYSDVCVGVPVILGKNGIEDIVELELDDNLKSKFKSSVDTINSGINILKENNFF